MSGTGIGVRPVISRAKRGRAAGSVFLPRPLTTRGKLLPVDELQQARYSCQRVQLGMHMLPWVAGYSG